MQSDCAIVEKPLCRSDLETARKAEVVCGLREPACYVSKIRVKQHYAHKTRTKMLCFPFLLNVAGGTGEHNSTGFRYTIPSTSPGHCTGQCTDTAQRLRPRARLSGGTNVYDQHFNPRETTQREL